MAFAMVALFGLQIADCVSAMSTDEQSMECCASMPCHPADQSHDCCKTMASAQTPSALPADNSDLTISQSAVFVPHLTTPLLVVIDNSPKRFEAPQHSPPDLYTLHSSLLI